MSIARILDEIGPLSKLEQKQLNARVADVQPSPVEVGPTFHHIYSRSPRQAGRVAEAFATTLPDVQQHRQLFQSVMRRPEAERRALISGYRRAGEEQWVV